MKTVASWSADLISSGRVTVADVAWLRSEVFPLGLRSRGDAAALFTVERTLLDKCSAWAEFFAEALIDHFVWGDRPTGHVDRDAAEWIIAQVDEKPTTAGFAALIGLTQEAVAMPTWFSPAVRNRADQSWLGAPCMRVEKLAALRFGCDLKSARRTEYEEQHDEDHNHEGEPPSQHLANAETGFTLPGIHPVQFRWPLTHDRSSSA